MYYIVVLTVRVSLNKTHGVGMISKLPALYALITHA